MRVLPTRTLAILLAFSCGAIIPQAHGAAWLVKYLIMTMLFIVFLQTKVQRSALKPSHLVLLAANLVMGAAGFGLGWVLGGRELAQALFFAGITPTATAAAVIISFLKGRVDYVVAAFLLTNLSVAALMPLILPFVLGQATPDVFARVFHSVLLVVFVPMALAFLLRKVHPTCREWPGKLRNVSFGLWISAMFLIMSNASHFLRSQEGINHSTLWLMGAGSICICAANFALGRLIGGRSFSMEASQALGQKNTAFTIYLAMSYASPLVALGPTFYVIWHNLWNSWQLHKAAKAEKG